MKKYLFWFLIILSVASVAYFIGYPYVIKQLNPITDNGDTPLGSGGTAGQETNSFIKEGWVEPVIFTYQRRDIPSIEEDFYAKGYPQFLYGQNSDGTINRNFEKSYHENGMEVHLVSNDSGYLSEARIEYGVKKEMFKSTYMNDNIPPLLDFIRIITNHEVSEEDQKALLRLFTTIFNDPDSKNNSIRINDLLFTVSLDPLLCLIILSC